MVFANLLAIEPKDEVYYTGDWCSVREAAEILGITKRAVHLKLKKGEIAYKEEYGNGGKQFRISVVSIKNMPCKTPVLPHVAKNENPVFSHARTNKLTSELSHGTTNKLTSELSHATTKTEEAAQTQEEERNVDNISDEDMKIACARNDLIKLYIEYTQGFNGETVRKKKEFVEAYNKGAVAEIYSSLGKTSYGTMERWKKTLENNGNDPACLVPGYKPRSVTVTEDQAKELFAQVLVPAKPPINEAIRIAKNVMAIKGIRDDRSDATYRRFILQWKDKNVDLWHASRGGEKTLNDAVLPFVKRDLEKIDVGDIVVADGHTLNFEVLNPFTGKPKRMTLISFADMKTGKFLGFDLMPTENTLVIASALRRTIMMLNVGDDLYLRPQILYLDNGRAFRAKYFKGTTNFKTSGISGLFQRLGINTIYAMPYHGQSKIIERLFGTLSELERNVVSYTGTSIANKPARMMRNEKFHRSLHERITAGTVITVKQAYLQIINWMQAYHNRPHQDGFYKGYTPEEIYQESFEKVKQREDFKSRLITRDELNYLMLSSEKQCKIGRNGVAFNNEYYWAEQLYGRNHNAFIKYDLFDDSSILVYDDKNEFICKAYKKEYTHPAAELLGNENDVKLLEEQLEQKGMLKKATMQNVKELFGKNYIAEKRTQLTSAGIEEELLIDAVSSKAEMKFEATNNMPASGERRFKLIPEVREEKKKIILYESDID